MAVYFFGIKIPEEKRKMLKLQSWPAISHLKDAHLVPTYNWHYTLAFLGPQDEDHMLAFADILSQKDFGPSFKLGIKNFGGFPDLEICRVLFASVDRGSERLHLLAQELRSLMRESNISFDLKPFVPHLTLLRNPTPRNLSQLSENGKMKQEIPFLVDEFQMYSSVQDKSPYHLIRSFKLS